jgi:hypothetical protein
MCQIRYLHMPKSYNFLYYDEAACFFNNISGFVFYYVLMNYMTYYRV